jgi:hypothetical protein
MEYTVSHDQGKDTFTKWEYAVAFARRFGFMVPPTNRKQKEYDFLPGIIRDQSGKIQFDLGTD